MTKSLIRRLTTPLIHKVINTVAYFEAVANVSYVAHVKDTVFFITGNNNDCKVIVNEIRLLHAIYAHSGNNDSGTRSAICLLLAFLS